MTKTPPKSRAPKGAPAPAEAAPAAATAPEGATAAPQDVVDAVTVTASEGAPVAAPVVTGQPDTTEGAVPAAAETAVAPTAVGEAEHVAEDLARKAEAVAGPGDSVGDIVAAQRQAPEAGLVSHLEVRAKVEGGFRRAGRHWPEQPTTVIADNFTPAQIEALETEPMLAVKRIEREAQ